MTDPDLPALELGNEVALRDLDKELKKLWESNEARTKASLANFAVYSERVDSLHDNTELIREIRKGFNGAFFFIMNDSAGSKLNSSRSYGAELRERFDL